VARRAVKTTALILCQDQPLVRLPYELLRKNFKSAQLSVERDSAAVRNSLKDIANSSISNTSTPEDVLKNLDSMISRMRGLKRKLTACAEEEARIEKHSLSRVRHLGELYSMQSLDDVKYATWSRTRLDRLLVDYLLRNGYKESAMALAKEKGIEELVDVETFIQMSRIMESLRSGKVNEVLAWCAENKKELRRTNVYVYPSFTTNIHHTNTLIERVRVYAPIPAVYRARPHTRRTKAT
jgi:macrophage erythroblast attacher